MIHRMMLASLLIGAAAAAEAPDWRKADLKDVAFEFRLVQDVGEIERLLGDRLDEFTLVEVRLRALYGTKVKLDRESFVLRSFQGNVHSAAQSPDRIAGANGLSLQQGKAGGGLFSDPRAGIPVGGMPGSTGPPRRVGDQGPTSVGSSGATPASAGATPQPTTSDQDQSLHGRLERLELPLDAGDADVSGYLYFQVDPKQKRRHVSLSYDGQYGEFRVSFEK